MRDTQEIQSQVQRIRESIKRGIGEVVQTPAEEVVRFAKPETDPIDQKRYIELHISTNKPMVVDYESGSEGAIRPLYR